MTLMLNDEIKGIKIEYIEWLIDIIRTQYRTVKKGTRYLETAEREYDLTALSNIRDFLSHIETAFQENIPDKARKANLIQSEEHLRRALVESHQTALEARLVKFLEEYDSYEKEFLKNERKYGLHSITDHDGIRKDIRYIQDLLHNGRGKKGVNIWNEEWEEGVEDFINGYKLTIEIQDKLKKYKEQYFSCKYQYDHHMRNSLLTILLFMMGVFVTILCSFIFSDTGDYIIKYLLNNRPI